MYPAIQSWSFREVTKKDPTYKVEKMIDETARLGFGALEVMSGKAKMPPDDFASDDIPYLKTVMRRAADAGLKINCLATYNDFAYVKDETWRLANIAYIKQWLQIAADLGVPNIRMLTGYYAEGEDRARLETLTRAGIRECIPVAERCGVNMAVENHNSIFFTADDMMALIDEMQTARLTTCPDPSNWSRGFLTNEDTPEDHEKVFASAAKVAPRMTDAHIKFRGFDADGNLMGFGKDLKRLLRTYRDVGYRGQVAIESVCDGDLIAPLGQVCQVLKKAIAEVLEEKA
jgi:sugar phosphate isomerase/epimerase